MSRMEQLAALQQQQADVQQQIADLWTLPGHGMRSASETVYGDLIYVCLCGERFTDRDNVGPLVAAHLDAVEAAA